jgi:hypothetical protein
MFGDAARVLPYDGLRNPGAYNLSSSVFRTFDITERWKFILRADCQNITNKVTFGSIQASMNNAAFGTVGSATVIPAAVTFSSRDELIFKSNRLSKTKQ